MKAVLVGTTMAGLSGTATATHRERKLLRVQNRDDRKQTVTVRVDGRVWYGPWAEDDEDDVRNDDGRGTIRSRLDPGAYDSFYLDGRIRSIDWERSEPRLWLDDRRIDPDDYDGRHGKDDHDWDKDDDHDHDHDWDHDDDHDRDHDWDHDDDHDHDHDHDWDKDDDHDRDRDHDHDWDKDDDHDRDRDHDHDWDKDDDHDRDRDRDHDDDDHDRDRDHDDDDDDHDRDRDRDKDDDHGRGKGHYKSNGKGHSKGKGKGHSKGRGNGR